ncbi:MAG TPA: DUF3090 family protein [Acidimicrobiia bacterium]|nr:DUF3090 family protein [Acidimicrobiia bacterium]
MALEDLGPAERFAAGALGPPGSRRFFVEVTASGVVRSFPCEKTQVAELAEQGLRMLSAAGIEIDEQAVENLVATGLEVGEPEQPSFRIGSIGVAIERSEFITVVLGSTEGENEVRFVITAEQFRAMALIAARVVASGRPLCPRCQLPMDPEGHRCPSSNGHHI